MSIYQFDLEAVCTERENKVFEMYYLRLERDIPYNNLIIYMLLLALCYPHKIPYKSDSFNTLCKTD